MQQEKGEVNTADIDECGTGDRRTKDCLPGKSSAWFEGSKYLSSTCSATERLGERGQITASCLTSPICNRRTMMLYLLCKGF